MSTLVGLLIINILIYLIGYWVFGGSTLLAEGYEGESWLRPWNGPKVQVSNAVGLYSLIHELIIFCTLPLFPTTALVLLYQWVRLRLLRRTMALVPSH
ncbi:MAG: hypothetical protein JKY61_01775 [Planctomycetes bacterium]|nr:hypothetical protein [Planctomycetota bacterium]